MKMKISNEQCSHYTGLLFQFVEFFATLTNKPSRNVTYMSGPVKITNMKRVMYPELVRHCHDVLTRT